MTSCDLWSQNPPMAREKPPEAGVPEWILTYGDMMSLLLCFFIMLYAMSTLQIPKIQAAIESLKEGFGYMGSSMSPTNKAANATRDRISTTGRARRLDVMRGGQPITAPQGEQPQVQQIRQNEEPVQGGLIRFDLGSDELNAQAKKDLDMVYNELVGSPFKILIRGHAAPGEQGAYRREIDLSYTRAINVWEYLVSLGIRREYCQISAVGPYEPIGRSTLPKGADPRLANTVVEVLLLSNTVRDMEGDRKDRELKYLNNTPIQ